MSTMSEVLKGRSWQATRNPITAERVLCRPDCPTCDGVGWIRYDVPVTDHRFGKVFPCPNIPVNSSLHDGHGLTANEIKTLAWSSIEARENVMDGVRMVRNLLKYGNGMGYLYGGAGLAKTKILQIACAEFARAGRGVFLFTTQKDILDDMRTAFDDDEPSRAIKQKQDKYIGFNLLAIDEITTERSTDFKVEQFFHVVNKRHEAGTERGEDFITLMASNVSPKELDFRITDRLSDGRNFLFRFTGQSYRPSMERK